MYDVMMTFSNSDSDPVWIAAHPHVSVLEVGI